MPTGEAVHGSRSLASCPQLVLAGRELTRCGVTLTRMDVLRSKVTLVGLALLLGLTGCAGGDGPEPSISYETGPFERESPSPEPSPTNTLTPDQQSAVDVVNQYFDLENQVRMDPEMDPTPYFDLLTGDEKAVATNWIGHIRQEGWIQVGELLWAVETVGIPDAGSIQIGVCSDSTGGDVFYQDTGEPVEGTPVEYLDWELTLEKVSDDWKVSYVENQKATSCDV